MDSINVYNKIDYINDNHKTIIYKNDLKYISNINVNKKIIESDVFENTPSDNIKNDIIFDSDQTENLYNKYKDKNKLDLRIKCSKDENYNYLDLSSLSISDNQLVQLFNLNEIKYILEKIEYLDLSNNKLYIFPNLMEYKNIKNINVSNNKIFGEINTNNYEEISCKNNEITCIKSDFLKKLDANNNKITNIDVKNINIMYINNNKLNNIESYKYLEYLECIDNNINKICNMISLKELYISNNALLNLDGIDNLEILNCVENPIQKINLLPKLKMMIISTCNISKKFNVENVKKIKNDYFVKLV
jgi:hypothetical protein